MTQEERARAFTRWLRTGWLTPPRGRDGTELKFNPYHDPRNGRFTFAPGNYPGDRSSAENGASPQRTKLMPGPSGPPMSRGANARAMDRAMTLEQSFPALRTAPGGAIIAIGDSFFDLRGPSIEAQIALIDTWTEHLESDLRTIDPSWPNDRLGPLTTLVGKISRLNDLRFTRAAILARLHNDVRPLQIEMIRFMQSEANNAYEQGLALLKAGRIPIRLSSQEALGNYIDAKVRTALRLRLQWSNIDSAGPGPVRVNRREAIGSGDERTFRRPDARVGDIAIDVTLTRKTAKSAQIEGFFRSNFQPRSVVIVRPRQIGEGSSYIINRPELLK